MDLKRLVRDAMEAMAQGRVRPLFDAMAEDVTWRRMGVSQWSRTFEGKQTVVAKLFDGAVETLNPSSSVEVHCIHADGDFVVLEHSGRNEMPDVAGTTTTTAGSFDSRTMSSRRSASNADELP